MKKFMEIWLAFIRWQGWKTFGRGCANGWLAFIHWKGWKALAQWPGWKKLLFPHPAVLALGTILSAAGLGWVFFYGMTEHPVSYVIYCVSAWAVTALCLRLPRIFGELNRWLHKNKVTNRILTDKELTFMAKMYFDQAVNLLYGTFKILSGIYFASVWLITDGIYNITQGVIQVFQIVQRKKNLDMLQQWKSYRLSGVLILLMHVTMTGVVIQMIRDGHAEDQPGFMIFVTALFAFYKLIGSFVKVAKDRKHTAPIDSAVRMLKLSQAFFAIFSLQLAMFQEFGGGFEMQQLMNSLTGGAVCLLVVSMGVYMIRRANRDMKKI